MLKTSFLDALFPLFSFPAFLFIRIDKKGKDVAFRVGWTERKILWAMLYKGTGLTTNHDGLTYTGSLDPIAYVYL